VFYRYVDWVFEKINLYSLYAAFVQGSSEPSQYHHQKEANHDIKLLLIDALSQVSVDLVCRLRPSPVAKLDSPNAFRHSRRTAACVRSRTMLT
jgi:hypothetical protein